jgi:septum site-determining protein MinC
MAFKLFTNSESIANIVVDSGDCDVFSALLESKPFKSDLQDLPVIVDIKSDELQANELAVMLEILAQNQVVVIGIRSNKQELIDFANFSGLAHFPDAKKPVKIKEAKPNTQAPKAPIKTVPPTVVNYRLTSEDQVVVDKGDLVLLDVAEKESELVVKQSVWAYQSVAGKVIAGIENEAATIYIQDFDAQLISIGGVYKKFDQTPDKLKGKTVMIDLDKGRLRFRLIPK